MRVSIQSSSMHVTAKARATLNGHGKVNGQADFTEYDIDGWKYVHIRVKLSGDPKSLKPGKHAVHIHEKAACDCDDFKCAGGHFDPGPNGNSDADANHGYHSGDLPMITVDEDGNGTLEAITTRITLSDGPVSILSKKSAPEGTSIMIHANIDPYTFGESGSGISGGPRLACGTIEAV